MMKKFLVGILLLGAVGCSNTSKKEEYYKNYNKTSVSQKKNVATSYSTSLKSNRVELYGKYPKDDFPISRGMEYLKYVNDMKTPRIPFRSYSENEFLNFYKNSKSEGYGDNSSYWRWKFDLTPKEINNILNKNLVNLAKRRPNEVLTLSGGKWVKKSVSLNPVGTLKEIKVLQRGKSGVIIKFMIEGTRGTYLVVKEGNVRNVLGLSKKNTGTAIGIYGSKGGSGEYSKKPISKNPHLLPSAYFAFEKLSNGSYRFYGGGYGHGVGIPQWAAMDLTKNHRHNYQKVLKRYYPNSSLKKMTSVKGMGTTIKVGIMTSGFNSLDHDKVTLYSSGKIKIRSKGGNLDINPRTHIDFRNQNGYTTVIVGGKVKLKTRHYISISSSRMISVPSIKRNIKKYRYPTYRGSFEIRISSKEKGKLRLINQVKIEDYLLQVVPSEMPMSFGLEALKVQAVAARTYAAKDYIRNRYREYGFHIVDSTQSQVYNNLDENEVATQAVKATKNVILVHEDRPIDAKYYSTSSGFNSSAENVW